jgi:hypothetical protein
LIDFHVSKSNILKELHLLFNFFFLAIESVLVVQVQGQVGACGARWACQACGAGWGSISDDWGSISDNVPIPRRHVDQFLFFGDEGSEMKLNKNVSKTYP